VDSGAVTCLPADQNANEMNIVNYLILCSGN